MDDRQAVYSEFQLDVLNRLSSIEQMLESMHSGFEKLTTFAENTTTELVSIKIECAHHKRHTERLEGCQRTTDDKLREYDKLIDEAKGGWKATTGLIAVITFAANALWILLHRFITGKL